MEKLFETARALLEQAQQQTEGKAIRYIAVSVVLEENISIDFRIASLAPETALHETHDEAVDRQRQENDTFKDYASPSNDQINRLPDELMSRINAVIASRR